MLTALLYLIYLFDANADQSYNIYMKDWTGNQKSIFTTLGASNHSSNKREEFDYYATSTTAIPPLIEAMTKHKERIARRIWENASGENHLVNKLEEIGFNVLPTDIIKRTDKTIKLDFLHDDNKWVREWLNALDGEEVNILTNPPYKFATEWVYKSMEFLREGEKLMLFLKIQFLEGIKRRELFKKYPPKYVFVFSKRQMCAKNGKFDSYQSSASCYAWFVWVKGYKGYPIIDWI